MADRVVKIGTEFETKDANSAIKGLNASFSEINQAAELGKKVLGGLSEAYDVLAGDTMKYANQTLQLTRITGASAEEASRLTKMTEDLGISTSALGAAMKATGKNGVEFTAESLGKLSDAYLKIQDPTDRETFLLHEFGKAGFEMAKMMELGSAAIKELNDAIPANLVLSQKQIDNAEKLRQAQNELNDILEGYKNVLGNSVIPILLEAAHATELLLDWQNRINAAVAENDNNILHSTETYEDYTNKYIQAALAAGKLTKAEYENLIVGREMKPIAQDFLHNLGMTTAFEYDAVKASDAMAAATKRNNDAWQAAHPVMQNGVSDWSALPPYMQKYITSANELRAASESAANAIQTSANSFENIKRAAEESKTKIEEAKNALATFGQGFAQQVDQQLKASGVKGEALANAEKILDQKYGTEFEWQGKVLKGAKDIADKYASSSDLAAFTSALDTKVGELENENKKLQEGKDLIDKQVAGISYLTSQQWVVSLTYQIGALPGPPRAPISSQKVGGEQNANGGQFVIPPGYNETWPVGPNKTASSGETVTITPAGQSGGSSGVQVHGDINIYVSGAGNPQAAANAAKQAFDFQLASLGKKYQGT